MAVVITDQATHIEIEFTGDIADERYLIPYGDLTLHLGSDAVYVSGGYQAPIGNRGNIIELHYEKVTTPSVASNAALYDAILTMLTT